MNYYNAIRENKIALSTLEPDSYEQFIISADNFSAFYREKNVEDYLAFFHQNYVTDWIIEEFFNREFYEKLYLSYPKIDETWNISIDPRKNQYTKYWGDVGPNEPVNEDGDEKFSPEWNKFKVKPLEEVKEFLENKKGKILDLGCGSGRHLIKNTNLKFYGVDFSKEMIKFAKINAKEKQMKADSLSFVAFIFSIRNE